jgi:hypothetical protein
MQQRLSIADLWNVLQRDAFYGNRDSVQKIVDDKVTENLIPPLTFDLNPQLKGQGCATDPVFMLIFVLCGLCRLNTYKPDEDKATRWFGQEFADKCSYKLDLEIDRDEFRALLQELKLRLPKAWFPDAPVSQVSSAGEPVRKRKRRYLREYEKARKIAQKVWEEEPDRPITWIIRYRLRKRVLKPDGQPFSDKAYRGWIQNLRPGYRGKNTPHN